jgi:glycosyltransferase involved in cell wall biosynthesis
MNFKIVCAGWECATWLEQTLRSIEQQAVANWDVWITYDPSEDDGAQRIKEWCAERDDRWHCTINTERKFAIRNQYEAIVNLAPADDDIVVFLDLDGDMLAHPHVLERLAQAYAEGALVTYGQYKPIPNPGTCTFARPYPRHVVAQNSYRAHHLNGGDTFFNHLRSMAGRIVKAIPEEMFKWPTSGFADLPSGRFAWEAGDWYQGSTDYVFMLNALELAGGRYHCFTEVLLLYNHADGGRRADNKTHPHEAHVCLLNFFARPSLAPLP